MSKKTSVKRWTAKRKSAVVIEIFKGKTTGYSIGGAFVATVRATPILGNRGIHTICHSLSAHADPAPCTT